MRIAKVEIRNFKRFESVSVELDDLDCLVGGNNTGKTTLLQALALFDFAVQHCLEKRNGGDLKLRNRTVSPEDFYILPVTNPLDLWHERRSSAAGKQRHIQVAIHYSDGIQATATIKLDYNRFGITVRADDESPLVLTRLRECRIAYLPVFSMFLPREERRQNAAVQDDLDRGRPHGVIRNLLLNLKALDRLGHLTDILKRSFPMLRELNVEFDEVSDRYISAVYKEDGRPKEFDIFSAGSGFQQFLYLFGFILERQPTVVLLDEPDAHLHGSLQAALLDELRRLVREGKQVLLATHSRELISRVGPTRIVSLDADGPVRLRVAFDVYDALDRLGSVDPTQLPKVQAYRRVVLLEGPTDREILAAFGSAVLGEATWREVARRVAFCFCGGNPRKQDVPKFLSLLSQAIGLDGRSLEMFVIADRDYHPEPKALLESLPTLHLTWHIWERTEIENYLLSVPALQRLAGARGEQGTFDELLLPQEFNRLVEASRRWAGYRLHDAVGEDKRLADSTVARRVDEYLHKHWESEKLSLADAKDTVLPGMKRWFQSQGIRQFSDRELAESLTRDELPAEVIATMEELAQFAGVALDNR